jgi:hypothetical protein
MEIRKRKLVYAIFGPLSQALGYVGGPLAIARRDRRRGWRDGRLRPANLWGLVPLAGGAAMLGWAISSHYEAAPKQAKLTVVPTYLARGGAYAHTRNPMYLGGAAMQIGWSVLVGSTRLAGAAGAYVLAMQVLGVPFEERLLERRFGDSYASYKQSVPRMATDRERLTSSRRLRTDGP